MALFHGTNMAIGKIDLNKGRKRVDFEKEFYLTDKYGTARDWAIRKVELEGEGIPTVLCYEFNADVYNLNGLRFPAIPEYEWLEFICSNRCISLESSHNKEPRHNYHWVSGSIADDKVVDVVAEYMREEITVNEAIQRLCALPQTYQLSLHTSEALSFIDDVNVSYKQLRKGRWTHNWIKRTA